MVDIAICPGLEVVGGRWEDEAGLDGEERQGRKAR